jgi:hypothetical protein
MKSIINKKDKFHPMADMYITNYYDKGIRRFMVDYCNRNKPLGFAKVKTEEPKDESRG